MGVVQPSMKHETLARLRCYQRLSVVERVQLVQTCQDVNSLLDYWNFEYMSDFPSEMVSQEIVEQLKRLTRQI